MLTPPYTNVPDINFGAMPESSSMALYKDKLLVYDNIGTPLSQTFTDEVKSFIGSLPARIGFTVAVMCLEGGMEIRANLRDYRIGKGEIGVFTPGTIGENINISPDSTLVVMTFSDDSYLPSGQLQRQLFSCATFTRPFKFTVCADLVQPMVLEYKQLKGAILSGGAHTDQLVSSYITMLCTLAATSIAEWLKENHSLSPAHVIGSKLYNDFMDALDANFIDHKDVAFYAERSGLSAKYFSKQIFKASGRHPLDWIKAQVILNAQAMLNSGEQSIAEIASALKFSSQSAFNRYFKDQTGVTPQQYRKS